MTLVSIIGDFHSSILPIFYEFKDRIKKHIIVYDDFKNDVLQAKKIIDGTDAFIKTNNLDIKTYAIKLDEDDQKQITLLVEKITHFSFDLNELYINATDGLTTISLLLSKELLDKDVKFITYDRYDNEYNVLANDGLVKHKISNSIPIKEHFLLKNTIIKKTESKQLAHELEKELALYFEKYGADVELMTKFNPQVHNYIVNTPKGFLYELYIYNLLKRLNHDDIAIGVKIKDIYSNSLYVQNEFDILIMKDNHLHMIECKFRTSIQATELIYKVDSVRQSIDNDAKLIIVTNSSSYDYNRSSLNPNITVVHKRATINNILLLGSPINNKERFIKDIDSVLNLQTKNIDDVIAQTILISSS